MYRAMGELGNSVGLELNRPYCMLPFFDFLYNFVEKFTLIGAPFSCLLVIEQLLLSNLYIEQIYSIVYHFDGYVAGAAGAAGCDRGLLQRIAGKVAFNQK